MALNLFLHFMIVCFSRNTAMSPSAGSNTPFTTTPVSPSTDGIELSACPKDPIPVVGMCQSDTRDGHSFYLDTSLYSDQFTECSCDVAVSAGNGSVDIYPEQIDPKNCQTKISIAELRYNLHCTSPQNHAKTVLNTSHALRVDITGHGVARYCLYIITENQDVTLQLNCLPGVLAGNNITSLTTSTAPAETTQLASSSPLTSLTSSASTSTSTSTSTSASASASASASIPTSTSRAPSTSILKSSLTYSTSAATPSSSTKAHTRTSAPETDPAVTSTPESSVSEVSSAEPTPPGTDPIVTSSPTSSVSATSPPEKTQKASLSTPPPLTIAGETTTSLPVMTKTTSKTSSSTQSTYASLSPSSDPSVSVTASLTTLDQEPSISTPISDNKTLHDASSPGYSFPVLGLAVGLLAGTLLLLTITFTVLFCRFRHQKTYSVDEEEKAASVVSPEDCTAHIQVVNPIYCDDPEMNSLSNYDPRPQDNVSNVSSFVSEEPRSSDPSLKDAEPELNQEQTEMMQTLVTKQSRDCSKRMTYCPPCGRKGSTQGLYRL